MAEKGRISKEHAGSGALLFFLLVLVLAVFAVVARAGQSPAGNDAAPAISDSGTLLLVRVWNPDTGELIGWLPIHQAAMDLEMISQLPEPPHFDLNQAVTLEWPSPPHSSKTGQLLISPPTRVFEGHRYVPVEKEANIVRIGKLHFLVRKIILGAPDWKRAGVPIAHSKAGKEKGKKGDGLLAGRP